MTVSADSTIAVRKVTTGPSDASNTVILSGLKTGENVVIDGVDRLRDGGAAPKAGSTSTPSPSPSPSPTATP